MSHVDPGTIATIRDRGLVDAGADRHVRGCLTCRAALDEARTRSEQVDEELSALSDDLDIDVVRAKAEVRRRLDERREAVHRPSSGPLWALGRAAVLLLAVTGVVYALPGSPLRDWLGPRAEPEAVVAPAAAEPDAATESEGIELTVPDTGLGIVLTSVAADATVEVLRIEGRRTAIVAGPGSRYLVSQGRAEVDAAPGPVRITLPRDAGPLTIEVGGRMILRQVDGELELSGDVVSRSADRIVFSVGGG